MNIDINVVLEQAKNSVAEKEYQIWLLKAEILKLKEELEHGNKVTE